MHRAGAPIISPLVGDTSKILELIMAGEDVDHAIDIDEAAAWKIVEMLEDDDQLVAFFMLSAGPRCADLEHILKTDVKFLIENNEKQMRIYLRRTKSRRTSKERFTVVVRPRWYPPLLTKLFVGVGPLFPGGCSVGKFNSALARTTAALGMEEGITSYSLRRRFIHTCISGCTQGSTTEWLEVIKATGHHSLEILRNSYAPKFSNVL